MKLIAAVVVGGCLSMALARADGPIDFSRDVRPLLSDNCFSCHGFDEASREANLRLDTLEGATADLGGYAAIVPGDPGSSELIARIAAADADIRMPPPDSHKMPLSKAAIDTLERWIRQGAPWGTHWSFEPPRAAPIEDAEIHPVDYFVAKRLAADELEFAPQAAAHTLARRLSFDLTGLPPTEEELAALGANPTDGDWQRWIDRLLDSPHYGERMAMWWLDGARYADTDGFQQDATRQNWPWRDWVIDSFNDNKPFDQFTIEQFAGDLLPDATDEQILATCFHRNHMHNGEGGRDPAESRVDYVLDRTNTMGTLWMGLTLGCTQCHDHKFDPISQRDYYSLTAFFNNIDESGQAGGGAKPFLKFQSKYSQPAIDEAATLLAETTADLKRVKDDSEAAFASALAQWIRSAENGFQPWYPVHPSSLHSAEGTRLTLVGDAVVQANDSGLAQDDYHLLIADHELERITAVQLEVFADAEHAQGKYSYADTGEFVLTNVKLEVLQQSTGEVRDIPLVRATASVDGEGLDKKYGRATGTLDDDPRTGWTTRTKPVEPTQRIVLELQTPLELAEEEVLDVVLMQRSLAPQELIGRFRLSLTDQRGRAVRTLQPMPMQRLASAIQDHRQKHPDRPITAEDLEASLRGDLHEQFLEDHVPWQVVSQRQTQAQQQLRSAQQTADGVNVTVLAERSEPRPTHVLVRGVWDQHGETVQPNLLLNLLESERGDPEAMATRLDLAKWIVDRDHPLTARVITNQVWQLFFGAGLVRTPSDFGLQGESPTHPELLDWLAVDFMEHGWDIKHLVRRIVTSRTYQQDSAVSDALLQRDPDNRLLARGARFRLPAWMIRDAGLRQSGLLNPMVGGPPVFPYQPEGIWNDQFMGRFRYQPSIGPAQYRRTVYAFWRRSSAPTFLFDSAMRRTCEVIPRRTNTPLQALTLLNNRTAQEASRQLSENIFLGAAEDGLRQELVTLFRQVLSRRPNEEELQILEREFLRARTFYEQHPEDAIRFTTVGQLAEPDSERVADLAAGMLLANLVLNLDESITHE